jgi:hypothetical protein
VLSLAGNELDGAIPPEIGSLSMLGSLVLSENRLSGSIPASIGGLGNLVELTLSWNQLSGSIPTAIGSLTSLESLDLGKNQLSGPIPAAVGSLGELQYLDLGHNLLSGTIPDAIGSLSNLWALYLGSNRFEGTIPSSIAGLSSLEGLDLSRNKLQGEVPAQLGNLASLSFLSISLNALETEQADLLALLAITDPAWASTQTLAPSGLSVTSVADRTAWLKWTPIVFTQYTGGYEVFSAAVPAGATQSGGFTASKTSTIFPVTGLLPAQSYDFLVSTFTNPHSANQNKVVSLATAPVMATTSDHGCVEPVVLNSGEWPATISVTTSHDTFEWSTGETTSSIVVAPVVPTWYWVRATSGACDEASVVLVDTYVFADDFESGDTMKWSSSTP